MKKILILLFLSISCFSQNTNRKYEGYTKNGSSIGINTSDGKYIIKSYSENIIETSFIPKGEIFNPESHAVVMVPEVLVLKVKENKKSLTISTTGLTVHIQKKPFQVSYSYKNKFLFSEKNGYTKKDSLEVLDFNIEDREALYGGGERALGMNRRGNRLTLYNRAQYGYGDRAELMNFTIPMVLSSKIYAIHFDNAPVGFLDFDSKKINTLAYETISGRKTYQVIAGDDWIKLTENYTQLTGRQPLPPRWTFGNFASRFGYHSQAEAEKTIKKFRDEKIPVDAIIFDLYWFGKEVKGTMGNLEIDRDSFPHFEKMVENFNKQDVKTILITEPFILTTSKRWKEAVDEKILATDESGNPFKYDFYFGNTGLIDIFNPKGKDWFWNIYKDLINKGVAGMWGDLGEPEMHPSKVQHATGNADEVHNIYGHNWAKLIFEGYQKDFPNQRPFILMRAGYSGSQRFGMIPWSGDVGRSWGGLQSQTEIALQMGMQGMAYMHSDLGGFAGDNTDNELYVRWLQYGVFQPVFRPHAQESVPPEVVFKTGKTKELAKEAVESRYSMLPYNYTLAFENNQYGTPLMRPLFFEEPENTSLYSRSDEYLWGYDYLVAPVTTAGQKEKTVYFPKTSNWFEIGKNQTYKAGSTHTIQLKEEYIPTFVRGGSFIPFYADEMQSTAEYKSDSLSVRFIYDKEVKKSCSWFYDDDGKTPNAFEKGNYEILRFHSRVKGNTIKITVESEKGKTFEPKERQITLYIYYNTNDNKVETRNISIKSGESKTISIPKK